MQVQNEIKNGIQGLGKACQELIDSSLAVQLNPRDMKAKKSMKDAGRNVNEKVSESL